MIKQRFWCEYEFKKINFQINVINISILSVIA